MLSGDRDALMRTEETKRRLQLMIQLNERDRLSFGLVLSAPEASWPPSLLDLPYSCQTASPSSQTSARPLDC